MDCFEESSLQLGDKCYYYLKDTDHVEMIRPVNKRPLVHYLLSREENQQGVEDLNTANSAQV